MYFLGKLLLFFPLFVYAYLFIDVHFINVYFVKEEKKNVKKRRKQKSDLLIET